LVQLAIISQLIDQDIVAYCAEWRIPFSSDYIAAVVKQYNLPHFTALANDAG
jgi:hypothetical protein